MAAHTSSVDATGNLDLGNNTIEECRNFNVESHIYTRSEQWLDKDKDKYMRKLKQIGQYDDYRCNSTIYRRRVLYGHRKEA